MWEGVCEVLGDEPCVFAGVTQTDAVDRDEFSSPTAASEKLSRSTASSNTHMAERTAHQADDTSLGEPKNMTFRQKVERGQFVITGEVAPPTGVDCTAMIASIRTWAPVCDAVNITDNQGATLHLSSMAAAVMARGVGVESIFQQTCRDRNSLALQSDLLAAHTLGLRNFLAVTGDNPKSDSPVRRMFDLNSTQLLHVASDLNRGVAMDGTSIGEPTAFYLGAAAFLDAEPWEAQRARIAQKIEAGAQFFQTQAIMDTEKAAARIEQVQQMGAAVIAGVLLLKSPAIIDFIDRRLEGLHVHDALARRIRSAADPLAESIEIAVEQAAMIAEVADGIHVMPLGDDEAGIEIIRRANIR